MLSLLLLAPVLAPVLAIQAPPGGGCPAASGPAVQVEVTGFSNRNGQIRVRLFGGAPATWFDKKHALTRIEVPVPATGRVTFCLPVPRAGVYAVDVRHDTNLDGRTDRRDGGGASGNPQIGLLDMVFGRKPDPRRTQVQVGTGATVVPITLMYLQGNSFRPWR